MSRSEDHATQPLLLIEALGEPRAFRLIGEMDLSNSCWVRSTLERETKAQGDLTLDLGQLKFIDGSGRHALAQLAAKLGERGRLILRNPTDAVERLFMFTNFDSVPNLIVDRAYEPAAASATTGPQQHPGSNTKLWGMLGLAQSVMPLADEISFTVREGGDLKTPVATGSDAVECDRVQYEINDGPCVEAAEQGQTVNLDLTADDASLTPFLQTARSLGIRAVLSIPVLSEPSKPLGALNIYSRAPGGLPAVDVSKAQVLAIRSTRAFKPAGGV